MVGADDASFEKRPHVLNAVRVNIAFRYVLLMAVLNSLMLSVFVRYPLVGGPLVGVDGFGITSGVLSNEAVQGLPVGSPNDLKADVAVALHGTHHDGLVAFVAAPLAF